MKAAREQLMLAGHGVGGGLVGAILSVIGNWRSVRGNPYLGTCLGAYLRCTDESLLQRHWTTQRPGATARSQEHLFLVFLLLKQVPRVGTLPV